MIRSGLDVLVWLAVLAAVLVLASWITWRSYKRFAERARGAVQMSIPPEGPPTPMDDLTAVAVDYPGQTGFLPLTRNLDAYAARVESVRMAGRSIDIMSYLWYTDLTGWLLIAELVRAADRGVRVRLLLDDVNVQGFDRTFLALNQHPNIEVRLFNPLRSRGHVLRRTVEMMLGVARFNRRMHGKMWIVDGRLCILGGRNVGDTYFAAMDAGARNSHDIDVAMCGTLVAETATTFDAFWNLGLSLPILTLWPKVRVSNRGFRRRIARKAHRPTARGFLAHVPHGILRRPFRFTLKATFIADPPDKALGVRESPWLIDRLPAVLGRAERQLRIITPYFVPGDAALGQLTDLAHAGVQVQTLTNALCSTDNIMVFGAYGDYRMPLLRGGVEVYEYGPIPRMDGRRDLLHTKLFLVDGRVALVGSVNLDLRSAYMNTELGVVVEEPALLAHLMAEFDAHIHPDAAFRLLPNGRRHQFVVERPGLPERMNADPGAGPALRLASWIVGRLPIRRFL